MDAAGGDDGNEPQQGVAPIHIHNHIHVDMQPLIDRIDFFIEMTFIGFVAWAVFEVGKCICKK